MSTETKKASIRISGFYQGTIYESAFTAEAEIEGEKLAIIQFILAAMKNDQGIRNIIRTAAMAYELDLGPESFKMFTKGMR
jgi:hypothetical protein